MQTFTFTQQIDMVIHECPVCGVIYGLAGVFRKSRLDSGGSWHCPNGHSLSFTETTLAKITRERDRLNQQIARAEEEKLAAERREAVAKRELKRVQKRVSVGVCPCCNRTFENLARHMKSKHPDVVPLKTA